MFWAGKSDQFSMVAYFKSGSNNIYANCFTSIISGVVSELINNRIII